MVYGYVRVSTDLQTVENQKFEITNFCNKNGITVEKWIEETVSGTKKPEKRELGSLLDNCKEGDLILCSELSRLGRSLYMIMSILNNLMNKNVRVWTIKDNFRLGDDIESKVLAFAFGLSAEIERNLISQRTREALLRKKQQGVILGHPKNSPNRNLKLTNYIEEIIELRTLGISKRKIARALNTTSPTLNRTIERIKKTGLL